MESPAHIDRNTQLKTEYTQIHTLQATATPERPRTSMDEKPSKYAVFSCFIQLFWISPDVPG
jgi:hypothetical protein